MELDFKLSHTDQLRSLTLSEELMSRSSHACRKLTALSGLRNLLCQEHCYVSFFLFFGTQKKKKKKRLPSLLIL